MPSKSIKQRRLMGYAYACKKGYAKNCPKYIMKLADSMSLKALKDYAKTKEDNLPLYKESLILKFDEFINESKENNFDKTLSDIATRIDKKLLSKYMKDNNWDEDDEEFAIEYFLKDEYSIEIDSDGIIEFDTLDDIIKKLIGDNYIKLYHFTSSKFKKSILENGLITGQAKTNPHGNSYSGVYLTTRTSGKEIDGYKYHIYNKYKKDIILVTVKLKLDDIKPDTDDIDIASGKTQFITDEVSPNNILSIEKVIY